MFRKPLSHPRKRKAIYRRSTVEGIVQGYQIVSKDALHHTKVHFEAVFGAHYNFFIAVFSPLY